MATQFFTQDHALNVGGREYRFSSSLAAIDAANCLTGHCTPDSAAHFADQDADTYNQVLTDFPEFKQ